MTGWNPNFPCSQGLEWASGRQADRAVTGRGPAGYAWSLESSLDEDVKGLWTFADGAVSNALDLIDIYDVGDLRAVPEVENLSNPGTATIAADSAGRNQSGAYWDGTRMLNIRSGALPSGVTNMAQLLGTFDALVPATYASEFITTGTTLAPASDTFLSEGLEGVVSVPHRSFLGFTPITRLQAFTGWTWGEGVADTGYPFRVTGLDTGLTTGTDRVLGLSTSVLAMKIVRNDQVRVFGDWPVMLQPFIRPDASWVPSGRGPIFGERQMLSTNPERYTQVWAVNPFTGREWKPSELASFGSTSGTAARIGWRVQAVPTRIAARLKWGRFARDREQRVYGAIESVAGAIFAAEFRSVAVEDTRVAFAYRSGDRRQKTGWNRWTVERVASTTGPWAKKAGVSYLFHQVVDEAAFGGGAVARGLNQRVLSIGNGGDRVPVRERVPTFAGSVPISAGEARPWAPAVVLETQP